MELTPMYPGVPWSPPTTLADSIGPADTTIPVEDGSALPDGPNLAVIGTDESGEVILYAVKAGNTLSGCTRGVEGTAQEWNAGSVIGRNWTNKDYAALMANLTALNEGKPDKAKPAAPGNLAVLAADGSLTDSGKKPADFLAPVEGAGEGNLPAFGPGGTLQDSGKKPGDFALTGDLSALSQTVTQQGQAITSQGQAITALEGRAAALEGEVSGLETGKADKAAAVSATLAAAGWTGEEAPFTQDIAAPGVTADAGQNILVGAGESLTPQQYDAAAKAQLWATGKAENTVTVTAFGEKPAVDLPVTVTILG